MFLGPVPRWQPTSRISVVSSGASWRIVKRSSGSVGGTGFPCRLQPPLLLKLEPLKLLDRPLILFIPSIKRSVRLNQQHVDFFFGYRSMLTTCGLNQELAFFGAGDVPGPRTIS